MLLWPRVAVRKKKERERNVLFQKLKLSAGLITSFGAMYRRVEEAEEEEPPPLGLTTYSAFASFAVTLNCLIGTGCFGLPFAFASGGLGLATGLMVLASTLGTVSMGFSLESMARAEGVAKFQEDGRVEHRIAWRKHDFAMIARQFGAVPKSSLHFYPSLDFILYFLTVGVGVRSCDHSCRDEKFLLFFYILLFYLAFGFSDFFFS